MNNYTTNFEADFVRSRKRHVPEHDVIVAICKYFDERLKGKKRKGYATTLQAITPQRLKFASRQHDIVLCRAFVIHYLRWVCNWKVVEIGYFLGRDHTSIVHSEQMFNDQMELGKKGYDTDVYNSWLELRHFITMRPENTGTLQQFLEHYGLNADDMEAHRIIKGGGYDHYRQKKSIQAKLRAAQARVQQYSQELEMYERKGKAAPAN